MTRILILLATVLAVELFMPAYANDTVNCGKLHQYWIEYKKEGYPLLMSTALQKGLYMGYIAGWQERDSGNNPLIDWPVAGSKEEVSNIVGNWLEDHPEFWNEDRAVCVYLALKDTYGLKE